MYVCIYIFIYIYIIYMYVYIYIYTIRIYIYIYIIRVYNIYIYVGMDMFTTFYNYIIQILHPTSSDFARACRVRSSAGSSSRDMRLHRFSFEN